ncbi:MAG TPA: hypothetical protein VJO35_07815 [Terriglobales bacterium]|nr:hypothetical protein [Terriglobales bacterium]
MAFRALELLAKVLRLTQADPVGSVEVAFNFQENNFLIAIISQRRTQFIEGDLHWSILTGGMVSGRTGTLQQVGRRPRGT